MSDLAIFGGQPVISGKLPSYNSIGKEERDAVVRVMDSGCLSGFYGSWGEQYFGGPVVREFERAWSEVYKIKHTISVNSATSGLFAALGAVGVGPGDEVIVPPYTMSATVMAPLVYGGIPVFVDIEPDTFCLDPQAVRRAITSRTKAILVVNLFGHPAALKELRMIADEHNIKLVEDNAQGPLAMEQGRYAGTIGHIGVFSLNYHKHIHTGEGGMCVTDDDQLALRLQMIRNHGENVIETLNIEDLTNIVGFNYRLTELSAAVGIEQLKKVERHVGAREQLARQLTAGMKGIDGLTLPQPRKDCRHVYYVWASKFNEEKIGVSREQFSQALAAEGFPHFTGYIRPLYLLPVFQKKVAIGGAGYPFNLSTIKYEKGMCPVVEQIHEKELIGFEPCAYSVTAETIELLIDAVHKVYEHRAELKQLN